MNGSLKIQSSDKTLGTLQNILFLHKNAFAERLQKILIVKKRIIHKETLIEIHIHIHIYVCIYINYMRTKLVFYFLLKISK